MKKRFRVFWTQYHEAVVIARTRQQAKNITLGLDDADTLRSIHHVVVELGEVGK